MKTSSVLASVLLGSLAIAAPVKRDYVTKTEVVVETVVIYTTVWDYDDATSTVAAVQTSDPGLFYEKPASTSAASTPSSTPAPPVVEPKPSSVYTPPPSSPAAPVYTPQPEPSSVYTPPPAPSSVYTPPPAPSSVYTPPPAPASSAAPEPPASSSPPSTGPPSGGDVHTGDITIYQPAGNLGACGTELQDTDPVVALSIEAFGASTYDYMTGAATNKWCGQAIMVKYGNREPVRAKIMDMCPGCSGFDIDLSPEVWAKVTGVEEMTRYKAEWWTI